MRTAPNSDGRGIGGRRSLLTPELTERICADISYGAYDWVAAEANGISRFTFYEWMRRGEHRHTEREGYSEFAQFAQEVNKAKAKARMGVEKYVRTKSPEFWLKAGPGKSQPDAPGWSDESKLQVSGDGGGPLQVLNLQVDSDTTRDYLAALVALSGAVEGQQQQRQPLIEGAYDDGDEDEE